MVLTQMRLPVWQRVSSAAYAALVWGVLPAVLALWAKAASSVVQLPAFGTPLAGAALALGGGLLMALGVIALRGGGLPRNALPPPKLVTHGVYRWLPHPIYTGFSLCAYGVAMAFQSTGGLWLVAPAVGLGSAALVFGYERPDLERRFGAAAVDYRWLPVDDLRSPAGMARIRCYLFVLLPWVAIYEIIVWSGQPKDAFTLGLPGESRWPILPWTEPLYMSTYFIVGLTPLLARTSRSLRRFMLRAWLAMAIAFPLYLTLPVVAPLKAFQSSGLWGAALDFERRADPPLAAFPSFHTIWAFVAAALLAKRSARWGWLWWVWALGIAASCVTTGQHWTADVIAGIAVSAGLLRMDRIWRTLQSRAEEIANSWREWRIGPVRVINYAMYGGLAAAVSLLIAGTLTGPGHAFALLFTAICGLAGAAFWAHWIEGSPRLLRPYGYYGGLLAVGLACLLAPLFDTDTMLILAAYSVAAPWLQAIGRLRCLVQGCCHGRLAPEQIGIRYRRPQSRVSQIAQLQDQPLHPTPLYSMLWNGFTAVVLARMWMAGCDLHLIAGVFAVLSGSGRFVEEAYRGEPQTRMVAGLPMYQWIAAATVALGAVISTLGSPAPAPRPEFNAGSAALALAAGLVSAFAMGVDFPASKRRFARLA